MAWTPLQEAKLKPYTPEQRREGIKRILRHLPGVTGRALSWTEAAHIFDNASDCDEVWMNDVYTVEVTMPREGEFPLIHLSIKRNDREPCHDWRDLQRIKNQLLGPTCEAVELYPASERVVDTANQYHLWGSRDPGFRFPIGFNSGRYVGGSDDAAKVGAKQREFPDDI